MSDKCYGSVEICKINAVKELFDNFATRSMAYDFHHVIGLVKFDSTVTTLHTFTETLEKFKVIHLITLIVFWFMPKPLASIILLFKFISISIKCSGTLL